MQRSELLAPEAWHDLIRRRATSLRKPLDDKKMPSTQEELGALLDTLDFPEFEAAVASGDGLQIALAIERERLVASWQQFSPEIRAHESMGSKEERPKNQVMGTRKISAITESTNGKREETPKLKAHGDGRPPGLHQGSELYEDLAHDEDRIIAINKETPNVIEYLITCRLLDGLTRLELAERCGKGRQWMYGFEVGGQMPNAESVAALKAGFFTNQMTGELYADRFEKFESLLEANRYAQLREAQKNCDYRQFGSFLRDSTDNIIRKELRAYLSGDGSSNDTLIQTRGLYATFLRRAAGFSNNESAATALGLSEGTLVRCEHYYGDEARFPSDVTYKENITALEKAVIAKELAENIPDEQRIGSLIEKANLNQEARWIDLPQSAPRKNHVTSLRQQATGINDLPD